MLSRHLLVQTCSRLWSRSKVNDLDGASGSLKCSRKIGQYAHCAQVAAKILRVSSGLEAGPK